MLLNYLLPFSVQPDSVFMGYSNPNHFFLVALTPAHLFSGAAEGELPIGLYFP